MDNSELRKEAKMSYDNLVQYLLNKYGAVTGNYFLTPSFKSKNTKIGRTKEGLVIHHIDEDKAIMLTNPAYAAQAPYEYQLANRLVYCNMLEHLLLHIAITKKVTDEYIETTHIMPGIGGALNYLIPELNTYYKIGLYGLPWFKNCLAVCENNLQEYKYIVKDFYIYALERFGIQAGDLSHCYKDEMGNEIDFMKDIVLDW